MIIFRVAKKEDFDFYYNLKCEKSQIYWGGFEKAPDREVFLNYYNKIIEESSERRLFFVVDNTTMVGYLQLTKHKDYEYEVAYGVSEQFRGCGYGYAILDYAKKLFLKMDRDVILVGYVRYDNIASKKCFQRNGFFQCDEYDEKFFPIDGEEKKMYLWKWRAKNE